MKNQTRIKKWRLLLLLAILSMSSLAMKCNECGEVLGAVNDLESDDEVAVREAIRRLGDLSDSACIMQSIGPLSEVMNDPSKKHDIYTRNLVPPVLCLIAHTRESWEEAAPAVDPLTTALLKEDSDLLRAKVANSLGSCGFTEVRAPLEAAAYVDQDAMVQQAAKNSLKRLGPAAVLQSVRAPSPAVPEPAGLEVISKAAVFTEDENPDCISPEMKAWMDKHLIVLDQNISDIPICEK